MEIQSMEKLLNIFNVSNATEYILTAKVGLGIGQKVQRFGAGRGIGLENVQDDRLCGGAFSRGEIVVCRAGIRDKLAFG